MAPPPDPIPPNYQTVRLSILQAMVASLASITELEPVEDPYGMHFTIAALGPLSDWDHRKQYATGVHVGPERKEFNFPYSMNWLTVNIEFRATWNRGSVAPAVLAEQVLGLIERRMLEDRSWGDLAIDTKIIGTEIDLVTYSDRSICGVCICEVQYRTSHFDPRNPDPDV